ncbi:hypothetical protein Rhow_000753 [Rhodococcus wratislaviensis]|uniref:Uncharacterized protein n=1 Tax=Rhodococcus wratislaviensis TaxID=44752 RepID=A0A402C2J9_RHOWR|nr:hypothetical protein Rhow_000753 [Rhodococcus wratislaviensis]
MLARSRRDHTTTTEPEQEVTPAALTAQPHEVSHDDLTHHAPGPDPEQGGATARPAAPGRFIFTGLSSRQERFCPSIHAITSNTRRAELVGQSGRVADVSSRYFPPRNPGSSGVWPLWSPG